jgi:membrane protease YdiL (CAAX protease family)
MTLPAEQPSHYLQWARRGEPGFFRYLAGALLALAISLVFGQIFSVVGALLIASQGVGATIVKTTFFGFILSFLLIPLIPALLNRRPWWSGAMPARKIEVTNLALGACIAIATMVVLNVITYLLDPGAYHFAGLDPGSWIPMLLIAAVAFFVQASTEEMVYRGYLALFVAAFSRSPILILGIPSFIFALPHYGNAAENIPKVSLFTTHGSSSAVDLVVSVAIQGLVVLGLAELLMRKLRLIRSPVLPQNGD